MKRWEALVRPVCFFVSGTLLGQIGRQALQGNQGMIVALAVFGFAALAALVVWLSMQLPGKEEDNG